MSLWRAIISFICVLTMEQESIGTGYFESLVRMTEINHCPVELRFIHDQFNLNFSWIFSMLSKNRNDKGLNIKLKFQCLFSAFSTRLFSVLRFESVIHEFDPYFNYRTTRFLAEEGFYNFHNWFDDRAWYPLGRIIGGTIYPGVLNYHFRILGVNLSVDVFSPQKLGKTLFLQLAYRT